MVGRQTFTLSKLVGIPSRIRQRLASNHTELLKNISESRYYVREERWGYLIQAVEDDGDTIGIDDHIAVIRVITGDVPKSPDNLF